MFLMAGGGMRESVLFVSWIESWSLRLESSTDELRDSNARAVERVNERRRDATV